MKVLTVDTEVNPENPVSGASVPKHPATWLNAGCWEDELPGASVIDEEGNVVAVEQPPPQQEEYGVYERYLEMANIAYGGKSW